MYHIVKNLSTITHLLGIFNEDLIRSLEICHEPREPMINGRTLPRYSYFLTLTSWAINNNIWVKIINIRCYVDQGKTPIPSHEYHRVLNIIITITQPAKLISKTDEIFCREVVHTAAMNFKPVKRGYSRSSWTVERNHIICLIFQRRRKEEQWLPEYW